MTEAAAPLDPLTLPLAGSRLIEASAGTGKTWTIAALVLRLVLGHGTPPRGVDQILVMTFTRAATRELGDRIRARLAQAAAVFRGEAAPEGDGFLQALLAAYPEGEARRHAAWRLAAAADAMDEAAVQTIDAWCQRMLREHAFDSGSLFDEALQADEAALRDVAVRDVWRQQVYPLRDGALDAVLATWPSPARLAESIRPLWEGELPDGAGQGGLGDAVARALAEAQALKQGWAERADTLLVWLRGQWARKDCPFNKARLGEKHTPGWLATLKAWALASGLDGPALSDAARVRLTTAGAHEALKTGCSVDLPPVFAAFDALMAALAARPDPRTALRVHAAALARERLAQLKAAAGTFGFADLLQRLDDALDVARHGERALRLRERIVDQYPVALIDEFQDTSPVQLSVFDRLYRIASDDPKTTLLLIGDPKQAIYAFRGADIQSYLRARQATVGRHHVLDTNHRSTQALVDAVNTLFQRAEARDAAGAFGFGRALPFEPVRAQGRRERLVQAGQPLPALTWVADAVPRLAGEHQPLFAALAAERIVALLNDAQAGFRRDDDGRFRRLRPADIAVLVRTGREAQIVRQALRRRGLASVYLSDRDSVFATPEAADLLLLLRAVAAPRDARLARAALATALLARTLPELRRLADDDTAFDRASNTLQALLPVWRGQGVLAMLRRALHAFDLPARWLVAEDTAGERRLTNVLHLAELLQAAAGTLEGEPALMRWLAQQIDGDDTGGDDRVLRLESDADLVQVVTIHKSKGLQYPVVVLPFVAQCRPVDRRDGLLWQPLPGGGRRLVTDPTDADLEAADAERLREDLRLLYVALTRAQHALWVGLAAAWTGKPRAPLWPRSAIGQLLCGPGAEDFRSALDALAAAETPVTWLPSAEAVPAVPVTRWRADDDRGPLAPAPRYAGRFDRDWSIASYSALVRDAGRGATAEVPAVRPLREDEPAEPAQRAVASARAEQPWHRFPRGAFAGNFLHDQLEWLAGEGFALDDADTLRQQLQRRCERQGWGHRADDVIDWLRQVCATPLPPIGAPLSALGNVWPEMEFWLPSDGLAADRIDALCRQHLWPGAPRPALPPRALTGLLMGFADLVFEHGGRYWVLDHKSNALGARDADYTADALQAAMCEHRYDVQAALYLLALHRLLRARLGAAYVPARQLGGAVYLFLRGVRGPEAGCCAVHAPVALVQALDALIAPVEVSS